MISVYSGAVRAAMLDLLQLIVRLALPLGILLGLTIIGFAMVYYRDPEAWKKNSKDRLSTPAKLAGFAGVAVFAYLGWSFLQQLLPVARDQIAWQESAEATSKPKIDGQPIQQSGPAVAALTEKTYTRTLTLPPDFVSRIGAEGIGVLAPYLQDPTAENVSKLADTFKRNGQNVVFTREVTRLEEEALPVVKSDVVATVKRLEDRAYDLLFEGTYSFKNPKSEKINCRFQFPVPQVGTMRDLKVEVDGKPLQDPNENGVSEWIGELAPGESRTAKVSYHVVGGVQWSYDVGSARRRVEDFSLVTKVDGKVRFQRYSMQPTSQSGSEIAWKLTNVMTSERIALVFPPDIIPRETFLQALGAMPVSIMLFLVGVLAISMLARIELKPGEILMAVAILTAGFAASLVVANYLGFIIAILGTPLLGGLAAGVLLKRPLFFAAVTSSLVPAAFLSAEHTGVLLLLILVLAAIAARGDLKRVQSA